MFIIVLNCDKTYLTTLVMVWQPTRVVVHKHRPSLQWHVLVLHPSPVDLKKKSVRKRFFCNISHLQVLTRTQCNSCCHSLGSLVIFFVQIKTQTKNRFWCQVLCLWHSLFIEKRIHITSGLQIICNKRCLLSRILFCVKKTKTQKRILYKRNIRAWFVKICEQRTKLPSWHLHLKAPVKLKSKIFFVSTRFCKISHP